MKAYVIFKLITALLPITNIFTMFQYVARMKLNYAMAMGNGIQAVSMKQILTEIGMYPLWLSGAYAKIAALDLSATSLFVEGAMATSTGRAWMFYAASVAMAVIKLTAFVLITKGLIDVLGPLGAAIAGLAAALYLLNLMKATEGALDIYKEPITATAIALAAGAVIALGSWALYNKFVDTAAAAGMGGSSKAAPLKFNKERTYDGGGTYLPTYDNGGMSTEHGMAILQKGESVIPKTQNMLGGGITLNMGDVNVQDGEDFAERVAAALPGALQRVNDSGAI